MHTLVSVVLVSVTLIPSCVDGTNERPEILQQRQETVDLCQARGGVPILNDLGTNIVRCDFPPTARPPEVER